MSNIRCQLTDGETQAVFLKMVVRISTERLQLLLVRTRRGVVDCGKFYRMSLVKSCNAISSEENLIQGKLDKFGDCSSPNTLDITLEVN